MFEIFFDPTASATAYGQRPKFVRAEPSATAEGKNCAYGPTLQTTDRKIENNNCLNELNDLKFCEVSRNSISNRCWKFQLSILKNKSFIPKKNIF